MQYIPNIFLSWLIHANHNNIITPIRNINYNMIFDNNYLEE